MYATISCFGLFMPPAANTGWGLTDEGNNKVLSLSKGHINQELPDITLLNLLQLASAP